MQLGCLQQRVAQCCCSPSSAHDLLVRHHCPQWELLSARSRGRCRRGRTFSRGGHAPHLRAKWREVNQSGAGRWPEAVADWPPLSRASAEREPGTRAFPLQAVCCILSCTYVRTIQYGNASLNCYLRAGIRCMDCFLFVVINSASWSNRKTHKQCQPTVQTMPRRDSGPHSALGAIVVLPGSPVFAAPG
jgi:hypothetical protein